MNLLIYTLRNIAGAIVTPPLVFLLVALAAVLYIKNKKVVAMQKIILGGSMNSTIELTLSQLVLGAIGGSIGSLILTSLGVIFNENSGIIYLFIVSILLMFIKPRFICFAYSGAILGAISIIIKLMNIYLPHFSIGKIMEVDILYLLVFIGVFHIIEGILVIVDGDRGAIPVFTNKEGKILGGYALKRYWVLPIAIMVGVTINSSNINYPTDFMQTPNWWPLIKSSSGFDFIMSGIISVFSFYSILGYSSVTFTRTKREKAISSGCYILIYGIVLVIIAQLSRIGIIGEILVVGFMPLLHEFMLKIQSKNEIKRIPKFISDEEGLVILEISTNSKAKEFGIQIGNKLISINDKMVNSEAEVYSILKENLYNAFLKIKDSKGNIKNIEFRHNKNTRLGMLLVPRNVNEEDIIPVDDNNFKNVLDTIKNSENKEQDKEEKKVDRDEGDGDQ